MYDALHDANMHDYHYTENHSLGTQLKYTISCQKISKYIYKIRNILNIFITNWYLNSI